MIEFEPKCFSSEGAAQLGGRTVRYRRVTENFLLTDALGAPEAELYTHSYLSLDSGSAQRPLLFGWNGGPGCSSVFVHMGFLGPTRVATGEGPDMPQWGPYVLEDNPDWLIDRFDIVLLDPVGTGWSRGFTPELEQKYFNTQVDADVAAEVIDRYLVRHGREDSPIYLLGESYGTTRAALVAHSLFSNARCAPFRQASGLILIGTTFDDHRSPRYIEPDALTLPTVAAVHHYHDPDGKPELAEYWEQAWTFATDTYQRALSLGSALPAQEREAVLQKLSAFSGLPAAEIEANDLHVNIFDYQYSCLAAQGQSVSINDGRFTGPAVPKQTYGAGHEDVGHHRFMPAFTHAQRVWQQEGGVAPGHEYVQASLEASRLWDFSMDKSPRECLSLAMARNPRLRVLFCTGYYDMITTLGALRYTLSHAKLPQSRCTVKTYESGHMVYVGAQNTKKLCGDIRAFLRECEKEA